MLKELENEVKDFFQKVEAMGRDRKDDTKQRALHEHSRRSGVQLLEGLERGSREEWREGNIFKNPKERSRLWT